MSLSLLAIVQTIQDELGLQRTAQVVNSTDLQTRQIFSLVNREGRETQQNYDWTALQTEYDLHVSQPIQTTGTVVQNNYSIFGIPTADLIGVTANNWVALGNNIPVGARIVGVGANSVALDMPASGSSTEINLGTEGGIGLTTESGILIGVGGSEPITLSRDTYPEPTDFDRFINETWWDRTNRWALLGPDSPQMDQWHRSGIVTIGPRRHFRQIGPASVNYRIWPPPGALDTPIDLVFEYITKNYVIGADGTPKSSFTADTDTTILDDNFFILGAKWRYFQIKGFDYASMQKEYIDYIDRSYGNDGGAKTLSLVPLRYTQLVGSQQVPDGNWPGNASSN